MKCLNLGCGARIHPDWTNVDVYPSGRGVIVCDLKRGIPFPDNSFDLVYHSHVLEHFPKDAAPAFVRECRRVLRPDGTLRVVVPDLESIARLYLEKLESAATGQPGADADYRWMTIELMDQMVRTSGGGAAGEYLRTDPMENEAFVIRRWGVEASKNIAAARRAGAAEADSEKSWRRWAAPIYRSFRYSNERTNAFRAIRDAVLKAVLGKDWPLLELGRYRAGGSIHQWMYDRYSLGALLADCGFRDIVSRSAIESRTPGWSLWNLDTEPDGSVYKPDSLFMEGVKP